jgi:hypothetical protein
VGRGSRKSTHVDKKTILALVRPPQRGPGWDARGAEESGQLGTVCTERGGALHVGWRVRDRCSRCETSGAGRETDALEHLDLVLRIVHSEVGARGRGDEWPGFSQNGGEERQPKKGERRTEKHLEGRKWCTFRSASGFISIYALALKEEGSTSVSAKEVDAGQFCLLPSGH